MTRASYARRNRRLESDNRMVHKLVKKTAQEMAGAYYEWQASQRRYGNKFYELYPDVETFMEKDWANFVHIAKECLVKQLTDGSSTEQEKMDIYEALINDATLPYSQQEVQITNFRH